MRGEKKLANELDSRLLVKMTETRNLIFLRVKDKNLGTMKGTFSIIIAT